MDMLQRTKLILYLEEERKLEVRIHDPGPLNIDLYQTHDGFKGKPASNQTRH
jgi:hypothetical protein